MLVDTHCHLDAAEFDGDREAVIESARAVGVNWMVVPSVEAANFDAVRMLSERVPECVYALGIHPMYTGHAIEADLVVLRKLVEHSMGDPRFVAIGEIGLDFFVQDPPPPVQLRYFTAQLELAREAGLPVLLHVRRSQDAVLRELRRAGGVGGIAHAFNGSRQQAQAFLDLGFALGFGGALTFERAQRIRGLVRDLPDSAHVLETDAPDIPPAWLDRGRNTPSELPAIAREFAALRNLDIDAALAAVSRNVRRVLPRLAALADANRGDAEPPLMRGNA